VTPHPVAARDKALNVNLDPRYYGAFAEIGAGQEVVRWFFRAGGAAGTISKSISAYDMKVSDAIYGPCARYVCRERLESMLEHEQQLNLERLSAQRALAGIARQHGFDASALRVRKGDFTWRQLQGWFGPASTSALAMPGSVEAWPASGMIRREASGQARCRSQAFMTGQITS